MRKDRAEWVVIGALFMAMVIAPVVSAAPIEFHDGIDLWLSSSGTADSGNVNLGWGRSSGVNSRSYDALIQFTDMFGGNPGQIPLGSTINSAMLFMWVGYDGGLTSSIYQMTQDWDAASTWYTIGTAGGIVPGINAEPTAELVWTGISNAWSQRQFDLTASVQDWSDGAGVYGWGFTRARDGHVVTAMSLDSSETWRPYLQIDFTAPPPGQGENVIPEPASLSLLGLGLLGMAAARLRRRPDRD